MEVLPGSYLRDFEVSQAEDFERGRVGRYIRGAQTLCSEGNQVGEHAERGVELVD